MTDPQVVERPAIKEFLKFMMFTPTPGAPTKRAKLAWSVRDGNPRITVFTNDPNDKTAYGIISCPMNPETFISFIDLFQSVANGENNVKYKIDCMTAKRDQEGKMMEKTLLSELWFGKDEQGVCWISALAPGRPKIRFNFAISDFHRIYKPDGNPLSEGEASKLQLKAVLNSVRTIFMQEFSVTKTYQNSNKPSTDMTNKIPAKTSTFDEDIPF